MNHLTSDTSQRLRDLADFLGEPFRSDLTLLLNEQGNELPTVAEEPSSIGYRLVLDDLAAKLRAGAAAAELLEMIARATSEDAAAEPQRAALEGVTAAAEAIREALVYRHPETGLLWQYTDEEVCNRFTALDLALDALNSADLLLNINSNRLEQQIANAVRLVATGEHSAGTIALIGVLGDRAGRAVARAIRSEIRRAA